MAFACCLILKQLQAAIYFIWSMYIAQLSGKVTGQVYHGFNSNFSTRWIVGETSKAGMPIFHTNR